MGDGRGSRGFVVLRFLAVLGALMLSGVAAGQAGAAPIDREGDPVVLKGSAVPGLNGLPPQEIVGFAWDGEGWLQVPVQVDERKVVSVGTLYPDNPTPAYVISNDLTFDLEVYADSETRTGPDDNLNLDANDEIAFMAEDTGGQVANDSVEAPEGVVPGKSAVVAVTDPQDNGKNYMYLFQNDGSLDPDAEADYVEYDFNPTNIGAGESLIDDYGYSDSKNPEDSEVSTAYYTLHSTDRWSEDRMEISAGDADGTDILDREAAQAGLSGCGRSEVTFSGNWSTAQRNGDHDEGTYVTAKDGPVRAIRSYMGANSGPYVQRDHIYYDQREDNNIYLRVHPMADLYSWTDYSAAANGMTYRNFKNPAGVTVDGVPETLTPATTGDFQPGAVAWEQLSGPQGSVSTLTSVDTDIVPRDFGSLYLDDSTPTATNEKQCGGDGKAYGNSGFGIGVQNKSTPNTDPRLGAHNNLTVHRTRYFGDPDTNGADAAKLADRVKKPLIATGAVFVPQPTVVDGSGEAKLKMKLPKKTLKGEAGGKKVKFNVRVTNVGDATATKWSLCPFAPRSFGSFHCGNPQPLKAGRSKTVGVRIRIPSRVKEGKLVKVRMALKLKGARTVRGVVRIKVR